MTREYTRADFGELVQGKHAVAEVDFAELVRLLITCIGEDEGLKFGNHSSGNNLSDHKSGDWTYEIDNANQITLRYWLNEFKTLEEPISDPYRITTPQDRSDLQNLFLEHVHILKTRVGALSHCALICKTFATKG